MPIKFGDNTGRRVPGAADGSVLAELIPGDPGIFDRQRKAEERRMGKLDRRTIRDAVADQVYIYNAGPFTRNITTLGSPGGKYIPGLAKEQVLKGLSVAGPLIEQALPELYPSEPPGRILKSELPEWAKWKDADGEEFMLADRPSIDAALRIIGGHADSKRHGYAPTPFEQGCFVSTIPEQTAPPIEPEDPGPKASANARREFSRATLQYEEDLRLWLKWEKSVETAQARFTAWALRRGEEFTLAFSKGLYVRDEEFLDAVPLILQKTVADWPFLAGTAPMSKTNVCWACHRSNPEGVIRCQGEKCGEILVSPEEYESRRPKNGKTAA